MGSTNGVKDEQPVHRVRISSSFEMGQYEVTQAQWAAVMGGNPSNFKGPGLPVENVSWNDVQEFLKILNRKSSKYRYRLPTEAEWEYACRAGSSGDYAGDLNSMGWYDNNSGGITHPVGQKSPNAWGLYDMHGNVFEWCQDWYGVYENGIAIDPKGPSTGVARVARGGGWSGSATVCRSAHRAAGPPAGHNASLGFRLVRMEKK